MKNQQQEIEIPQEAFDWYDEYAHGVIDRRTFLARLGGLAITGLSASAVASALIPNYALAEQVSFNDSDIKATYEEFESPLGHGQGRGYMVVPAELDSPKPTILVVHENRGLNPYVKDVARRFAKLGFIAFAPDALHTLGGYPGNDDQGRSMQKSLDRLKIEQDFIAAAKFLKTNSSGSGKLGVVGFCFGGYISNMLAASIPHVIDAAVPFYGTPAKSDVIESVEGPLMLQFAEIDKRVNATWHAYEALLKNKKVDYQAHIYAGTNHGFHNDSTHRYDEASAELAWSRTVTFFNEHLGKN